MEQRMKSSIKNDALPLVSVVILSWNRKKELLHTLTELRKQTYPNLEIIVVDNNSTDGTCEMIESGFPEIKLIKLPRNIGIEGYNIGFKNAKGKYIVVLDDDSYPEKDAIKKSVDKFEKDPTVGIIAFHIITPNKEIVTKYWPEEVTSFWGCGAAIRRSVLEEAGYYDENLFIYGNEHDLSIRFWNMGYKTVYDREIICIHCLAPSKYRIKNKGMFYGMRGEIWFNLKYFHGKFLILGLLRAIFANFLRSIKYRTIYGFILGIISGFFNARKALQRRKPVSYEIMKFYFSNRDFYEPIIKRIIRLYQKKSFEEAYYKKLRKNTTL